MKTVEAWAIKDPDPEYGIEVDSVAPTERRARLMFMSKHPTYSDWRGWGHLGYRAVRVRIEEIAEGE